MRLGLALLASWVAACVPRASSPASLPPATAAALQALLDDYALFTDGAGISLTVTHEGRTFDGAAGVADRVTRAPLQPGARFRVGSNTKLALAIIAAQLEAEGKLSLDDPLGKYVGGYPAWADITLRDLLAMRAGIPEYVRSQSLWFGLALDPRAQREPSELLRGVEDAPLATPPGTSCSYANTNYLLVGLVLEAVTGTSVKELVRARLVEPLGLASTFMDTAGDHDPRLAHGYLDVPTGASSWDASPLL